MTEQELLEVKLYELGVFENQVMVAHKAARKSEAFKCAGIVVVFTLVILWISIVDTNYVPNTFFKAIAAIGLASTVLALLVIYFGTKDTIAVPGLDFKRYTGYRFKSQLAQERVKKSIYKSYSGEKAIKFLSIMEAIELERVYLEGMLDYLSKSVAQNSDLAAA